MKPIPKEVQDAAKVIAKTSGFYDPGSVILGPHQFAVVLNAARGNLTRQRRARTDSRWIRLNSAAEVMRRYFGGGEE